MLKIRGFLPTQSLLSIKDAIREKLAESIPYHTIKIPYAGGISSGDSSSGDSSSSSSSSSRSGNGVSIVAVVVVLV